MKKNRQNIKSQKEIDLINEKFKSLFTQENIRIVCYIVPYLTYKEVISLSNTNKSFYKIIRSHKSMKSYIIKSKMQSEKRLLFYATNLNLSETKLTIEKELYEYKIKNNFHIKINVPQCYPSQT